MKTAANKTARTLKRTLALIAAVAAMLTLFALPASAKSANGFQYFVEGPYEDDGKCYVTITGHKSAVNGTLTIPAEIGGDAVWSISEGAFAGRTDITKVVVPDGVGYIGSHAFEDCSNLRTLVIGDVSIWQYAFSGCTALKKVKITAFKNEYDTSWRWDDFGNEALFAAEQEWTRYKTDVDVLQTEMKGCTNKQMTLTAAYGTLKKGESYHWYSEWLWPDDCAWEDCAGETVTCTPDCYGRRTVYCDVVSSKGEVVWSQEFDVCVCRSLADAFRSAVQESYLYGVTEYTNNHFRWAVRDLLYKIGIDVYDY